MPVRLSRAGVMLVGLMVLGGWGTILQAQGRDTTEHPVTLGGGDQALNLSSGDQNALQVTGYGAGDFTYDGRTGTNTFEASTVAVGIFKPITDYSYFFGQLTTSLGAPDTPGGEPTTETEIDNLIVSVAIPSASNLLFNFGKVDLPIGFERDDAPLNLLASTSYNFELARPVKMVGVMGWWTATPRVDVSGFVFNGWDTDLDPNKGKSGGARLGLLPSDGVSLGLSGLYGAEGDQGATNNRYLLTFDYALQPAWNWIIAGEANYGGDRKVMPGGGDATWSGAMMTIFHQLNHHLGIAGRAEVFRDGDGARTGTAQTLESYTIAPVYSLGVGREGIFANVQHTTYRIPQLQFRAEMRINHSDRAGFRDQRRHGQLEYRIPAADGGDVLLRSASWASTASGTRIGRSSSERCCFCWYWVTPTCSPSSWCKTGPGLTPDKVQATYVPPPAVTESGMPDTSMSMTQPLDLGKVTGDAAHGGHAAAGAGQPYPHHDLRDRGGTGDADHPGAGLVPGGSGTLMILGAFGFGALDFAGQWLMKFGHSRLSPG